MMEVTPTAPIPRDEVKLYDSTQPAPPTLTYDGHKKHLGQAHGRVAPLIGLYRPYLLDVSADKITDNHLRVYADSADDVIGILVGGEAPRVIAELEHQRSTLPDSPLEFPPINEELALLYGEDEPAPQELSEEEQEQYARYLHGMDKIKDLEVQLAGLIAGHADAMRCAAQKAINDRAKETGRWQDLTEEERAELEASADSGPEGTYPTGILEEVPFVHLDRDDIEPQIIERGVWSSKVPLVCNRGNYFPWSETIPPESFLTGTTEAGEEYVVPGEPNLVWLEVESPQEYLESLAAADVLDVTTRPVDRPVEFMRDFMEERRVRNLEKVRELADAGDKDLSPQDDHTEGE